MDEGTIQKRVREYVVESFLVGDEESEFSDDQSFLDSGLIDSTGILEVIAFLEDEFEIEIDDEEMVPENLDSVSNISHFVASKRSGS